MSRRRDVDRYGAWIGISWDGEDLLTGKTCLTDPLTEGSFEYLLRFDFTPWPQLFPYVQEAGKAIRRHINNHVYPNGRFCFETDGRQRYLINTNEVGDLDKFHKYVLLPHLAKQFDFHNGDRTAFQGSERPHGNLGILSAYRDILGVSLEESRRILLSYCPCYTSRVAMTKVAWQTRHHCACGSGIAAARCSSFHALLALTVGQRQLRLDAHALYFDPTLLPRMMR